MVQIPYKPYADVNPVLGTGARGISVQTPGAAFGTTVAGAVEAMGGDISQVGGELQQRALAFQDLDNRNAASTSAAHFTNQADNMDVDLRSQQGKNAVDRFQSFPTDLEAKRQEIRDSLPNEMAKRYYDAETRGTYNNINKSGAMWAAEQHRVYTNQADDAQISTIQKQFYYDPADEAGQQKYLGQIKDLLTTKGQNEGWDDAKTQYEIRRAQSGGLANRVLALAQTQPLKANEIKENIWGQLTEEDQDRVTRKLNTVLNTTVPRMVSAGIHSGSDWSLGNKVVPIERAAEAIHAAESATSNYQTLGPVTKTGDRALGRYQVMASNLGPWLKEAGMPSMTPEEFVNGPYAKQAQDQLFAFKFGQLMQQGGSFNEAASRWFSGRGVNEAVKAGANDGYHSVQWYLSTTNAALAKSASEDEVMTAAGDKADSLGLNVPGLRETTEWHAARMHRLDVQAEAEQNRFNANTVLGAVSALRPDGHYVTTRDELLKDPQVNEAFSHLKPQQQIQIEKHLAENAKNGYPYSEAATQRYRVLDGMDKSPQGKQDFADLDLQAEQDKYHLQNGDLNKLIKKQQTLRGHAEETPRLTDVLNDARVKDQMGRLGIAYNQDPDRFHEFNATLDNMIQSKQGTMSAPMSLEDKYAVFQDAIKGEAHKKWFGFSSESQPFAFGDRAVNEKLWDELSKNPAFSEADETTQREMFNIERYKRSLKTKPEQQAAK